MDLAIERHAAVALDDLGDAGVARRNGDAEGASQRQRPDELQRLRQVAEALAPEERGGDRVERLGADLLAAGAADVPAQPGRQQHLVLGVLEEHVLQRHFHVVEAVEQRGLVGVEELVGAGQRDAEVGGEALGDLGADVRLARRRVAGRLDVRDRRQRQLVGHEGIVDAERRREEPLADEPVGLRGGGREDDRQGGEESYPSGRHETPPSCGGAPRRRRADAVSGLSSETVNGGQARTGTGGARPSRGRIG